MTTTQAEAAFSAFRAAAFEDGRLMAGLRAPRERDAYVAHVVATGAARGFAFDEATVRAVMREGELMWLMQGADIA